MSTGKSKKAAPRTKASEAMDITFTCKFCEQPKELADMVVITRFSPPVISCKACEKTIC